VVKGSFRVTKPGIMQHQGLKQRSDIHLTRKVAHCVGICFMAALYNFGGPKVAWIALILVSVIISPLDILRKKLPGLNRATLRIFGPFMRKHESNAVSGMTYLYLGCAVLLLFRDLHIITLTLLFLAFGDPIASFFGIRYGKDFIIGRKTLQGTMAAFVVCAVITGVYCYFNNLMTERLLIVAPLGGLIGAVAELIPVGKLDDNLTFPIISGLLLYALFFVFSTGPV
jgi:diacylglycerol kinase (CTP)